MDILVIVWLTLMMILQLWILYYFFSMLKWLVFTWIPYVNSFDKDLNLIEEWLKKLESEWNILLKWKTLVDLWCWNGKVLRFFNDKFWVGSLFGYDINGFSLLSAKVRNLIWWYKNIIVKKKDFTKISLEEFNVIYVYLFPGKFQDWILENIKPWQTIICNSFEFKKLKPSFTIKKSDGSDKIYIYKI